MAGTGGAREKREASTLLRQWMRITEWEARSDPAIGRITEVMRRLAADGFSALITVRHHQPDPKKNPNGGEYQVALWRQITTDDLLNEVGLELEQDDPWLRFLFESCEACVEGTTLT